MRRSRLKAAQCRTGRTNSAVRISLHDKEFFNVFRTRSSHPRLFARVPLYDRSLRTLRQRGLLQRRRPRLRCRTGRQGLDPLAGRARRREDDLSIAIEGSIVRIETKAEAKRQFKAAYELPQDIDAGASDAKLENGVLTLKLGKLVPVSQVAQLQIN